MPELETSINIPRDREVVKKVESPRTWNYELVEQWGDGIPKYSEADPQNPEWQNTPVIPVDLSREGYGMVYIKNEADRASNPTGTIKDRAAWELATLYRDMARAIYLKIRSGEIKKSDLQSMPVPNFSFITSGNEGRSVAVLFEKYGLPPPKLIIGSTIDSNIKDSLKRFRADIYQVDLNQSLTTQDIKRITDNEHGIDITSSRFIEPSSVFYDWHVHEVFNQNPGEIYVSYGSGRLMENYITWQQRNARSKDPRLQVDVSKVISMNIFGARAEDSLADKLIASFRPFLLFQDEDIADARRLQFTGSKTLKTVVGGERIREAHEILNRYAEAEPSAAAGLALYMDRWERGLVDQEEKVLVVNTGRGLIGSKEPLK